MHIVYRTFIFLYSLMMAGLQKPKHISVFKNKFFSTDNLFVYI